MRLARENAWGHERIQGELLKLGYEISDETVANILRRHGIPPVPERDTSPSWRHLMTHYKDQLLAAISSLSKPCFCKRYTFSCLSKSEVDGCILPVVRLIWTTPGSLSKRAR